MLNAPAPGAGPLNQDVKGLLSDVVRLGEDASVDNESLWRRLDLLPVPVLLTRDASAHDMRANLAGQRLFRANRDRNLSQSTVDPERPPFQVYSNNRLVPVDELPMQKAAATGQAVEQSECELRFEDGSSVFILGHCIPLFDAAGNVRASLGAFVDITDRKRLERENLLLAGELAHRAKNTLALIQSIASLTLRRHLPKEIYRSFEERLMAFGRTGEMLSRSNWHSASIEASVRGALLPYVGDGFDRVELSGPEIVVSSQTATSLSLAMNELATNATKYGALSSPDGLVSVQWQRLGSPSEQIAVEWTESGGPRVAPPKRKGFGLRLLTTLLGTETESEIRFDPDGVRCRILISEGPAVQAQSDIRL